MAAAAAAAAVWTDVLSFSVIDVRDGRLVGPGGVQSESTCR